MLQTKKVVLVIAFIATLAIGVVIGLNVRKHTPAITESETTPTPSAYRELLSSEVRGIDADTIEGYLTGAGLGFALPAELNGYPGPRHVLDLASDLELTPEQREQIQSLFDEMESQAIELGQQTLDAEAELEQAFREKTISEDSLNTQLVEIGQLKARLRFVHLRTHLATVAILSQHQVMQYNALRGYGDMPAGHHNEHE